MREPQPLPAPAQKTDWRDGKHPLSVRVREKAKVKFMEELIGQKGNAQAALDHCIGRAMVNGVNAPDTTHLTREIARLQSELEAAKKKLLEAPGPAGLKITLSDQTLLERLMKVRKLKDLDAGISYCIKYTKDNDWL